MILQGVIEWSLGECERYIWRNKQIQHYRTEPVPAPVNYGCLPDTFNPADQAEIDAVWLGSRLAVGTRVEQEVTGLLQLLDGDHKVIFGQIDTEAMAPLLAWFPESRGAKVLAQKAAEQWLEEMLS